MEQINTPKLETRAFWLLFLTALLCSAGLGSISPLLPGYQQSLGLSGLWVGILFAAFSLAQGISMPFYGKISDKIGRRPLVIIGMWFFAFSHLLYLLDYDPWLLLVARVVNGLASGLALTVAMAYIGDTATSGHEGALMGNFNVSVFIGLGLGPLVGGVLGNGGDYHLPFLVLGGITLTGALVCTIYLPALPELNQRVKTEGQDNPLKHPLAKGLLVFRFVNAIGRAVLVSFLPLLALSAWGMGPAQVGIVVAAIILSMSFLQIVGGIMADKGNRVVYLFAGSTIFAIMVGFVPFAGSMAGLLVVGFLMALGGALAMPSATALIAVLGRKGQMGSAMGAFNSAMALGLIIAPILAGVAEDVGWAEHETIFWVASGLGVIGSIVFFLMANRDPWSSEMTNNVVVGKK